MEPIACGGGQMTPDDFLLIALCSVFIGTVIYMAIEK